MLGEALHVVTAFFVLKRKHTVFYSRPVLVQWTPRPRHAFAIVILVIFCRRNAQYACVIVCLESVIYVCY